MVQDNDKRCRRALTHRRIHLTDELPAKSLYGSSESSITQDLRNVNLRLRLKWMKCPPSLRQTSLLTPSGFQLRETHTLSTSYTLGNTAEKSRLRHHYLSHVWARIGQSWVGSAWSFRFTDAAFNTVHLHCRVAQERCKTFKNWQLHVTKLNPTDLKDCTIND